MLLHDLLVAQRETILNSTREDVLTRVAPRPRSEEAFSKGIIAFFDQLEEELRPGGRAEPPHDRIRKKAAQYGSEMLGNGLTLSQVVHSYGALCQAITGRAEEEHMLIDAGEAHVMNRCLDEAIAGAVMEVERLSKDQVSRDEVEHLGVLANELRTTLTTVTTAVGLIRAGLAGTGGRTAELVDRGLARMQDLIDRSLAEVRLRVKAAPILEHMRLSDLTDQLAAGAAAEAEKRGISLSLTVDSEIELETDQQLLASALSNLIHNGLTHSRSGGRVALRASVMGDRVLLEVEDSCGGILAEKADLLIRPFTPGASQGTSLGLGLSTTKEAVERVGGSLRFRDVPGSGCIFTVDLPNTEREMESPREAPEESGYLH